MAMARYTICFKAIAGFENKYRSPPCVQHLKRPICNRRSNYLHQSNRLSTKVRSLTASSLDNNHRLPIRRAVLIASRFSSGKTINSPLAINLCSYVPCHTIFQTARHFACESLQRDQLLFTPLANSSGACAMATPYGVAKNTTSH